MKVMDDEDDKVREEGIYDCRDERGETKVEEMNQWRSCRVEKQTEKALRYAD